jgi:hypothetical protein
MLTTDAGAWQHLSTEAAIQDDSAHQSWEHQPYVSFLESLLC